MRRAQLLLVTGLAVGAASPVLEQKSHQQPQRHEPTLFQQQPASDQRGTEQSPFVIKILSPLKADERAGSAEANTKHESSNEGWFYGLATGDKIAAITALVGLLQFVALVVTFRIMRRRHVI